jgi:hypothetical protein
MNEEDFVYAWLLSAKAGQGGKAMSIHVVASLIDEAKATYRKIKQEYSDEVISRTED